MSMVKLSASMMLRWSKEGGLSLSRISSPSSHLSHFVMSEHEMDALVLEWQAFRAKVGADARFAPPETPSPTDSRDGPAAIISPSTPGSLDTTESGAGASISANDTAKGAESSPAEQRTLV